MTVESSSALGAHVRIASREPVLDALSRLQVVRSAPTPVWPPHPLPFGLFVSAPRNGWVSIWSPLDDIRDWFSRLTATLECAGVIFQVIESEFWIGELYQDGSLIGRIELPTEAVELDDLWGRTADSLEAEGMDEPWEDEARFGARMDEIAASEEYREELQQMREERPKPEVLLPFLPPHAKLERAWEILTAIDRRGVTGPGEEEESEYAEEYLDAFAAYLGIRNASWDPRPDEEAFSEGEYEDEDGLPDGWREFVVLPVVQLRVL